jgi:hypothetical protein
MAIGSWGPPLGALDPELQDERLHASVWSQLEAMRIDPLNTGALQGRLFLVSPWLSFLLYTVTKARESTRGFQYD